MKTKIIAGLKTPEVCRPLKSSNLIVCSRSGWYWIVVHILKLKVKLISNTEQIDAEMR
jgi:hypothetical protein